MRVFHNLLASTVCILPFFLAPDIEGKPAGGAATAAEPAEKPDDKKDPVAPAVAEDHPKPAATVATVAAAKPTVFARAAAMLKDKSELLTTISGHEATITDLRGQLTKASETIQAQTTELTELKAGQAQIEAALAASEKKNSTVEAAAQDKIAMLGFPADKLPAASSAEAQDTDAPKTIEEFKERHGVMSQKDPTAAGKFYSKYAQKFGL